MAKIRVEVEVPNGEECFGCQHLISPTYYSRDYVCDSFHIPVKCYYDLNTSKGYYERHIYKCDECKKAEVEDEITRVKD